MPSSVFTCTGCDFESIRANRPVTIRYVLGASTHFDSYRERAWCADCNDVCDAECSFDPVEVRERINEIKKRKLSVLDRLKMTFSGRLEDDPRWRELELAQLELLVAEARFRSSRCLECGSTRIGPIDGHQHSCGGVIEHDFVGSSSGIRFSYRPEIVCVDLQGNRKAQSTDLA